MSWDEHDDRKNAVTGLLSSGLSSYSVQHSHIGGYIAVDNRLTEYQCSEDLPC